VLKWLFVLIVMNCALEKNWPARLRGQGRKLLLQYFDGLACYQERTSLWALCTSRLKTLILNKKHQQSLRLT